MRQGQQNRRGRGRNNNSNNNTSNNNRKSQNPMTRSFESAGPDVKLRGTPSHIAEKYISLARDALSSGDPVLAENYLQHAEHYNRIILTYREQQISQGGDQMGAGLPRPHTLGGADSIDGDEFGDDEGDDFGNSGMNPGMSQGGGQGGGQNAGQPGGDQGDGPPPQMQPPRNYGQQPQRYDNRQPRHDNNRGENRPNNYRNDRGDRQDFRQDRNSGNDRQDRGERFGQDRNQDRNQDRGDRPDRGNTAEARGYRDDRGPPPNRGGDGPDGNTYNNNGNSNGQHRRRQTARLHRIYCRRLRAQRRSCRRNPRSRRCRRWPMNNRHFCADLFAVRDAKNRPCRRPQRPATIRIEI